MLIRLCGCAGWSVPLLFAYGIKNFLMTWLKWYIYNIRYYMLILFPLDVFLWWGTYRSHLTSGPRANRRPWIQYTSPCTHHILDPTEISKYKSQRSPWPLKIETYLAPWWLFGSRIHEYSPVKQCSVDISNHGPNVSRTICFPAL